MIFGTLVFAGVAVLGLLLALRPLEFSRYFLRSRLTAEQLHRIAADPTGVSQTGWLICAVAGVVAILLIVKIALGF